MNMSLMVNVEEVEGAINRAQKLRYVNKIKEYKAVKKAKFEQLQDVPIFLVIHFRDFGCWIVGS